MFQAPHSGSGEAHLLRPPSTQFGASSFQLSRVRAACSLSGGLPFPGGGYSLAMLSRVAVGTDGSATASEAVNAAAEIARRFDAELVLLGVFQEGGGTPGPDDPELQWSSSPAARLREILERTENDVRRSGVECRTLTDEGEPGEVLVRLAESCEADVLVIGNKGMHRRVLGSVPNTVTHRAPCSVYVVKTT
jgi:nucleotide-binding universal stress UspA family protein